MDQSPSRYRTLAVLTWRQLIDEVDRHPRLLVLVGLVASLWLALVPTLHQGDIGNLGAKALLERKEDMYYLYTAAKDATWSDVPKWWVGPWNWPGVPYYRPITSTLFFVEYRLFGDNFTAYNRVSWVFHGINTTLLYLLVISLFRERKRARWILGFIAVRFFAGMDATFGFAVGRALGWFPAQNDTLSLLFSLLCLLLLDVYLTSKVGSRGWKIRLLPVAIVLSFFCSIGSKEMGYVTMPVALLLMWHRGRLFRSKPPSNQSSGWPHIPSGIAIAFVAFAAAMWLFRRAVVPHAWAPEMWRPWILQKLLYHWSGPFWFLGKAGVYWPLVAGVLVALTVWLGLRFRRPVWQIAGISFVITLVCGEYGNQLVSMFVRTGANSMDGSWALVFDRTSFESLTSVFTYILALVLFWKYRRLEPGLFALGALAVVFIPILQYGGLHYFYWPGAFLGLADAVLCACAYRWAQELRATADWSFPTYIRDKWRAAFATEPAGQPEKETIGTQA